MDNAPTNIQVYWMALKRAMDDANATIEQIISKGAAASQFTVDVSSNPSAVYTDFHDQIMADYNAAAPLLVVPPVASAPDPAFFHFMSASGMRNRGTMKEIADALGSMAAVFMTNNAPTNVVAALPLPTDTELGSEAVLLLSWWHDFGDVLVEAWRWTDPHTPGIYNNTKMNASLNDAKATITAWSAILDQDEAPLTARYDEQIAALQQLLTTLSGFEPPMPLPSNRLAFADAINAYSSVLKMLLPVLQTELDLIKHLMALGTPPVGPPDPYVPPWLGTYNPPPIVSTFVPAMPLYIYAAMVVVIAVLAGLAAWIILKFMFARGVIQAG